MKELRIILSQVEKTDLGDMKTLLNGGFSRLLDSSFHIQDGLDNWFDEINKLNSYWFAIRAIKQGDHRHFLVGICGITSIDWVARHGYLSFFMLDRDGHKSTMQNFPATRDAVGQLLRYAFKELNLNKVWLEMLEHNDGKDTLEHFGFVAEGIRRAAYYRDGKFLNSIVCSLTYKEYLEAGKII